MLDHKVSPLLDAMEVGECFARHGGASCYLILHPESGREFVLKHISVPASEEQVEALLLTGAYSSEEEADAYYRKEAEALVREAEARKKLLDCPYILPFLGVQMEKKEGVGYDVYAVLPKRNSLETYLSENAVSHLRSINLGIDLCVALSALREEGYVHGNLKPGNVFFSDTGRFLLGDFGLISTEDMQYAVLPEQYRSSYTAPELSGYLGGLNPTVDIYSLGMILYRIYNGNHAPFEDEKTSPKAADAKRIAGEELPEPLYADYELAGIIRKACAYDPAERYQSPEEMRIELEQYMRRNAVSDHLIVPPLVTDEPPLSAEAAEEQPEPVRFTDPEKLDEGFKKTFAPEEGKKKRGKEKKEKKHTEEDEESLLLDDEQILSDEPPQIAADRRRLAQKLKKARQRRRRAWIAFAAVMTAVVILIGLYEFTDMGKGLWHYFVKVDSLEVRDVTADSLRLRITTSADPADFTAYCQDAYGNSYTSRFVNGVAVFRDLNANTQYNLKVELSGLHSLSGTTTASASTKARTELLSFEAAADDRSGSVRLELSVRDEAAEPAFWTLSYGKTGEEPVTVEFTGHSHRIDGLENGAEYTFTLLETDNVYLSGKTETVFTPCEPVEATDLRLESVKDGEAVLGWLCTTELPAAWTLTCTAPDGKELPVELQEPVQEEDGWHCTAVVPDIQPDTVYTVKLSAAGMYAPVTLELKDDVIALESFTAEATADGLSLQWTANREPAAGWRIVAVYNGDQQLEDTVHGESCVMAVLPDTDYRVTIEAADGTTVSGENALTVRSRYSQRFLQMGLNQATTIGLYYTPEKENWGYNDLNLAGTISFRHEDKIAFAIIAGGWPMDSDEEVTVHYVIRDGATNAALHADQAKLVWNEMWDGNRWCGELPWLPETPGSYIFAIYINSQRVGAIGFTLKQ
jgi:serine/threonine protein kinase